ncbi:MAG: hypothetical protein AAF573_17205, partial [Bacteroidota bacterium]
MKKIIATIWWMGVWIFGLHAQEVQEINVKDFNNNGVINFYDADQWLFRSGHDPSWAQIEVNVEEWEKLSISDVHTKIPSASDRLEGWFRMRFRLDDSFKAEQLDFQFNNFGQTVALYLDGQIISTLGQMPQAGQIAQRSKITDDRKIVPAKLESQKVYTVAIRYIHEPIQFPYNLMAGNEMYHFGFALVKEVNPQQQAQLNIYKISSISFAVAICLMTTILFWILFLQNRKDDLLGLLVIFQTCLMVFSLVSLIERAHFTLSIEAYLSWGFLGSMMFAVILVVLPILFSRIFTGKLPRRLIWFVPLLLVSLLEFIYIRESLLGGGIMLFSLGLCLYYMLGAWRNLKGAQWAIVIGTIIFFLFLITIFICISLGWELDESIVLPILELIFPIALLASSSVSLNRIKIKVN